MRTLALLLAVIALAAPTSAERQHAVRVTATALPWASTALGGLSQAELLHRKHLSLEVTVERRLAGPLALYTGIAQGTHIVPGIGFAVGPGVPIGTRVRLGRGWDVAIEGAAWGYSQRIPVPGSRRHVFSGQVDVGKQLGRWRVGASFLHVSNAGTGEVNPGFNTFGLSLGWGYGW